MKGSAKGKALEVGYRVQSLGAGIGLGPQEESTTKARRREGEMRAVGS